MGLGGDAISGFIERGHWTEVTSSVVSGTLALGLDDPLGPARRIDIFGTETTMMWVGPSGGGGGGGNSSSYSVTGWNTIKGTGGSTRKLFNPNRRRSGSFMQQDAVERNTTTISKEYLKTLSNMGINFYSENEFNDFNQMLNQNLNFSNKLFISTSELRSSEQNFNLEGIRFINNFLKLIYDASAMNMSILFISTERPLELSSGDNGYQESEKKSFGKGFNGIFQKFGNTFVINYQRTLEFINKVNLMIHESGHLFEFMMTGGCGHSTYFYQWYIKMRDDFYKFHKK